MYKLLTATGGLLLFVVIISRSKHESSEEELMNGAESILDKKSFV